MERERFESTKSIIILLAAMYLSFFAIGYFQYGLIYDEHLLYGSIAALLGLLLAYLLWKNTYLEIEHHRILKNSGYRDIGSDTLDIVDIKYIYRIPAFVWRSGGSLMMIYTKDAHGELRYSALREVNYSNDTLKRFLRRLRQIKPSIELDQEYEDFLAGKYDYEERSFGRWVWSKNTVASVEARLREKGEKWDPVGPLGQLLNKFR